MCDLCACPYKCVKKKWMTNVLTFENVYFMLTSTENNKYSLKRLRF